MSDYRDETERAYPGGPTRADLAGYLAVMEDVGLLRSELIDGKPHYQATDLFWALPREAHSELIRHGYSRKGSNWQP